MDRENSEKLSFWVSRTLADAVRRKLLDHKIATRERKTITDICTEALQKFINPKEGNEMKNENCYTCSVDSRFGDAVLFDPERWGEGADMAKIRDAVENRFFERTGLQILPRTSECVGPESAWDAMEDEDLVEILDEICNEIWENEMEDFLVDEE